MSVPPSPGNNDPVNNDMISLTLSQVALNPTFNDETTQYTGSVPYSVSSTAVTVTVSDANVTVSMSVYDSSGTQVYGPVTLTSGQTSDPVSLNVGENIFRIDVTAENGTMNTYMVTVTREQPSAPGGSGEQGGSGGTGSSGDQGDTGGTGGGSGGPVSPTLPLIINDRTYDSIATGQIAQEGDKTTVTATIDKARLENQLQSAGDNPVIIIPAAAIDADQVVSVLTAETVKIMEDKQAVLEIQTVHGNYKLPAERMDVERIVAEFGESVDLAQITINVEIARSDAAKAQLAEAAAENGNFTVIVPPVDFTVTATYNGRAIEIDRFDGYVEREIPLPASVDASRITTAVVIENDGTVRHVPTYVTVRDGVYYAVVHSLTNSSYTLIWNEKAFADVANHWSRDAVNDLASRLVINGTTPWTFSPNQNITRAQFAAIVVRALGLSDKGDNAPFADVNASDWYAGAVAKAYEYGLIQGYGDGTFRPHHPITRQEAMVILHRALRLTGLSGEAADTELTLARFTDAAKVAGWAKEIVAAMVEQGLVQGSDGKLDPYGQLTRAQAAAMVHRLLKRAELID